MLPLLTAAANADWLDQLGNNLHAFLLSLFSREEFGLNQLLGSLSKTLGWVDLVLALALLVGAYFLSNRLLGKMPAEDGNCLFRGNGGVVTPAGDGGAVDDFDSGGVGGVSFGDSGQPFFRADGIFTGCRAVGRVSAVGFRY